MSEREQISSEVIKEAIDQTAAKLKMRLEEKGYGAFVSIHEILGIVTEEFHELVEAVRWNNQIEVKEELLDIAVGAIFGVACINNKYEK